MTNRAFITFGRTLESFTESGAAKLTTLWFDELRFELAPILNSRLIHTPGGTPDFEEWKRRVLTLEEPDIDEEVFQTIRGLWKSADLAPRDSLPGDHLPPLLKFAIESAVTDLESSLDREGAHPLDKARETGAARANLERHMAAWLPVSHEIALIGDSVERTVLRNLSSADRGDSAHQTFCDVIADAIPDFAALTWTEIVELRCHGNY